jgi:KaiC/GvpD/RAD55 family RecA-like ATPase
MTALTTINHQTTNRNTSRPQRRKETGPRIRPLGDLLNDDTIKPRQQLCGPWLLERGFAMVFAPTGVGKSWFAMGVAAAVASGGKFGHWEAPEARRVLYIDGEMDASDLRMRFGNIIDAADGGDGELIAENVYLYARNDQPEGDTSFPDFGKPEHTERILAHIRSVRPKLVVLDNLSTLATVDDDNAADAWDDFLKLLQKIRALGATVLVVHHANKGGDQYRGSSKIPVMFDTLVRLRRNDSANDVVGAAFLLDFTKNRMLTEDAGRTYTVAFANEAWHWDTLVDPTVHKLVRLILSGRYRYQQDAGAELGLDKVATSRALDKAYDAGITTPTAVSNALKAARAISPRDADDDTEGEQIDF